MDTIFALATARGRAGVAIVRISGPRAWEAAGNLVGELPEPKAAALRIVRDSTEVALDQALVLAFAEGESFTGECVVELHLHGSSAVIAAVLRCLSEQDGLRLANPGEFTRRALESGQLDLAQVEGLADLIDAETEAQRVQALKIMRGALGKKAERWRNILVRATALLEVTIDFADEDVPVDVTPEVLDLIGVASQEMQAELDGARASENIRDGFEVAIIGRPNIGKSTLLNRLAGKSAAITSEIAGTTRDVIEVRMDLGGIAVTLLDTAGLRDSDDAIEKLGVARAVERAEAADIRVFLVALDGLVEDLGVTVHPEDIIIVGKADIIDSSGPSVSGKTGAGVDMLLKRLTITLEKRTAGATSVTRERHRTALINGISALKSAKTHVNNGAEWSDLAAEEMRQSLRALDSLVGRVDIENILDEIFSSFCLGK